MPPRRRTNSIRRPRVAGLTPTAQRAGTTTDTPGPAPTAGSTVTPDPSRGTALDEGRVDEGRVDEGRVDEVPVEPVGNDVLEPQSPRSATTVPRWRSIPVLAVALVLLTGLAGYFGLLDHELRSTPSAANTALVDLGDTVAVAGQLGDALEVVYSYDFARLDENERAAREVITPGFVGQFTTLFGEVRQLAPRLQAVSSATVTMSAVKEITGDRAVLVAFMNQQTTRVTPGAGPQQLAAAGRLTVTGERIDGRWKIAAVTVL